MRKGRGCEWETKSVFVNLLVKCSKESKTALRKGWVGVCVCVLTQVTVYNLQFALSRASSICKHVHEPTVLCETFT